METIDATLMLMFPFGALWGFGLCNLLNSRRQRKCPMVRKSHYDEVCRQRDECLEGFTKQITVTKGLTESLVRANKSNVDILETLDRANKTNEELIKLAKSAGGGGLDNGK